MEVGDDPELVKDIVSTVKKTTDVPVIAKVGLGTTHYLKTVGTAIDSGIDAITAINTAEVQEKIWNSRCRRYDNSALWSEWRSLSKSKFCIVSLVSLFI